jgi:3-hydroxyacyl-CoA dehydrogenase
MVTAGYLGKKSGEGFYDYSNKECKDLVVSQMFK